jgi:transaldolase
MSENPLLQLQELGQSPWCDSLSRTLIAGDLGRWIRAGEITGVTSNPTIFEKAIDGSDEYDEDLRGLARAGKSASEVFDALAVQDIRATADLLRPIYERTGRADGYVSLEVSPKIAYDTAAQLDEARRLFKLIGRENAFIKIPGTPQGIPAFEQAIAEGLNINVTLLFSIESYEQVARAYMSGLEKRLAAGKPIDHVASVASFFVSRVDTAVDAQLEQRISAGETELNVLLGKAAIANAKLAYESFKKIFAGPRWQALTAKGATLQRPLWGSTSTKNPRYPDVMYVDELIGPHTVNTMPPATIEAFRDHGKLGPTLEQDLDGARDTFRRLAEVGIDLDAVTRKLQEDGVVAFAKSYDELMEAIERKRAAVLAGTSGAAVRQG